MPLAHHRRRLPGHVADAHHPVAGRRRDAAARRVERHALDAVRVAAVHAERLPAGDVPDLGVAAGIGGVGGRNPVLPGNRPSNFLFLCFSCWQTSVGKMTASTRGGPTLVPPQGWDYVGNMSVELTFVWIASIFCLHYSITLPALSVPPGQNWLDLTPHLGRACDQGFCWAMSQQKHMQGLWHAVQDL